MKTNKLLSAKTILFTTIALLGSSLSSYCSSYTASFNGSWSSATSWNGSTPGFNVTGNNTITIPAGVTLVLDSDLALQGDLILSGGILNLNGQNLTLAGAITTTGTGAVIGNVSSDITFNGYGGSGNLVFSPGSAVINNLTINIGSNSGLFLGTGLTVYGMLSLQQGFLGIGDSNLIISDKGSIQGGSATSYIMTNRAGSLVMTLANSGAQTIFPVGTQNNYAPFTIANNSTTAGTFSANVVYGVLSGGCTGTDISADQNMVNTTWNVSSSITTGINANIEMSWNTGMQVNGFNNTEAYATQYTPTGWGVNRLTTATANNNGTFSMEMASVTSLSQFAVFGGNTSTAVNNVAGNTSMSLYPNPAKGYVNISLDHTGSYPFLKVFDALGKEVISQQIESDITSVDINNLEPGVYFASLDGKVTQKFIKD